MKSTIILACWFAIDMSIYHFAGVKWDAFVGPSLGVVAGALAVAVRMQE